MQYKFYEGHRWVYSRSDIPTEPHYAVMEFGTIYIPSDERSRTCPGHGYPESTETKIDYLVFDSKESWEAYVAKNRSKNIFAAFVTPATITEKVEVSVKGLI